MPVAVLHAEALIDVIDLRGDQLIGNRKQVDIVGFDQRVDFAEREQVIASLKSQH